MKIHLGHKTHFNKSPSKIALFSLLCILGLSQLSAAHDDLSPKLTLEDPKPISFVKNVLTTPKDQNYCNPIGQIKDTCCDFQSVEDMQRGIFDKIQDLVKTKFFRYYKLNLWRECPFWDEDGLCMNKDCSVETTDESILPKEWTQEALSALQMSPAGLSFQPFKACSYKDQDYCLVEDQSNENVVYVNLLENPERFTGYAGVSAGRVWKAIYEENCFNIVHQMTEGCQTCSNMMNTAGAHGNPLKVAEKVQESVNAAGPGFAHVPKDTEKLDQLLSDLSETTDGGESDEEVCLEKRVYYRLISGLHSSISLHICDEWFNRTSGEWGPNLDCFVNRIGSHPERLQNVYFTYALVLRAVTKAGRFLDHYDFYTGDEKEDVKVKHMVHDLIDNASSCAPTFDEKTMFQGPDAKALKLEFRDHFRNVSRIMDCVGCEKCRLWGKIQTTGLGTALKVLFSYEDNQLNPKRTPQLLQRSEIVAMFNTLNRLSESIRAIQRFRKMYLDQVEETEKANSTEKHSLNDTRPLGVVSRLVSAAAHTCSNAIVTLKQWGIPVPVFLETILKSLD